MNKKIASLVQDIEDKIVNEDYEDLLLKINKLKKELKEDREDDQFLLEHAQKFVKRYSPGAIQIQFNKIKKKKSRD